MKHILINSCSGCDYMYSMNDTFDKLYHYCAKLEELTRNYTEVNPAEIHTDCPLEDNNQWISLKDRLPEKSGRYLAHLKTGEVWVDVFDVDGTKTFFNLHNSVTHWMPLPNPPEK